MRAVEDARYAWTSTPGAGQPRLHAVEYPVRLRSGVWGGPKDRIRLRCSKLTLRLDQSRTAVHLVEVPDRLLDHACPECFRSSRARGSLQEERAFRSRIKAGQMSNAGQGANPPDSR